MQPRLVGANESESIALREASLRAVAGGTEFGRRQSSDAGDHLRRRGIAIFSADLGIDVATATRDGLAAKTIGDLVTAFGGLYAPLVKFRAQATKPTATTVTLA